MPMEPERLDVTTESATPRDETPEQREKRARDERLLALARKQLRTAINAEQAYREEALDDQRFRAGVWRGQHFQWDKEAAAERKAMGRPAVTVNRAPSFIRLLVNQIIGAHLSIQVLPVDDQADPKKAEVLQGIIRNIEANSFADRAIAKAAEKQAEIGLGAFELTTEYAQHDIDRPLSPDVFRQRVRIRRVKNPLQCYWDPAAQEPDYRDAQYAFKVTDIDRETYRVLFGREAPEPASFNGLEDHATITGDWFPNGKVRIAMWAHREVQGTKRVALLDDGQVIEVPRDAAERAAVMGTRRIVRERTVTKQVIMLRKIDAQHVLEETEWPADAPPWIPVLGDELEIDGEIDRRGILRDAKETGRMYNVHVSNLIEAANKFLKAPIIGAFGAFGPPHSQQRRAWEHAERVPVPFLEYNALDADGKPVPPPSRPSFHLEFLGLIEAIRQCDQDYKTQAGYRDASLAEKGPQESGRAILARQRQDELANAHYLDNMRFALASMGRQLIQIIRRIYDMPTVLRITGQDDVEKTVLVFSGADKDPRNPAFLPRHPVTNEPVAWTPPPGVTADEIYDLSVGEFDVVVNAGPDSGTRRQEAVEAMTELLRVLPPDLSAKLVDIYLLMMDFPKARQMAERVKDVMGIGDERKDIPPQVKAALQAAQAKEQALTLALGEAQETIRTKRLELISKENIAALNAYLEILRLIAREEAADRRLVLQTEARRIEQMFHAGQQRIEAAAAGQPAPPTDLPTPPAMPSAPAAPEPPPMEGVAAP